MALPQSDVSALLEPLRAGDGIDLVRDLVRLALQELMEAKTSSVTVAGDHDLESPPTGGTGPPPTGKYGPPMGHPLGVLPMRCTCSSGTRGLSTSSSRIGACKQVPTLTSACNWPRRSQLVHFIGSCAASSRSPIGTESSAST